jgi:hypothetical protein
VLKLRLSYKVYISITFKLKIIKKNDKNKYKNKLKLFTIQKNKYILYIL